ncbi:hypothetical protein [Microbacterium xylanilyticum]
MSVYHLQILDLGDAVCTVQELCARINGNARFPSAQVIESFTAQGSRDRPAWVIAFDTTGIRGAYVHDIACRAGFVCNLQHPDQTALNRKFRT